MFQSEPPEYITAGDFYDRVTALLVEHGSFIAYGPEAYRFSLHNRDYYKLAEIPALVADMPRELMMYAGQDAASMVREAQLVHEALMLYHEAAVLFSARNAIEQADNAGRKTVVMPEGGYPGHDIAARVSLRLYASANPAGGNELLMRVAGMFASPPPYSRYQARSYAARNSAFSKLETAERITGRIPSEEELCREIYNIIMVRSNIGEAVIRKFNSPTVVRANFTNRPVSETYAML